MLINCPRCAFSQPQDQFCAHCGIDMQSFKPQKKAFLIELFSSTWLQVSVLIVAAAFLAHMILNRAHSKDYSQKNFRSQGISKSTSAINDESTNSADEIVATQSEENSYNKAEMDASDPLSNTAATDNKALLNRTSLAAAAAAETNTTYKFKLIYAEVPNALAGKWIVESTNTGLYQSLPEYSMGIIYDFNKKAEKFEVLKQTELKIPLGSQATNLAGLMSEDGSELIGLATSVELKSIDNESLIGHFNLTKGSGQNIENYPSDFELPKGSAFFVMGTLKIENFLAERTKLQMPPFQIYKSNNFMTRKTEFVIIVQPDYK